MSINAHISELKKRHGALDQEIMSLKSHPSTEPLKLVELKRKKLQLKDELRKLDMSLSLQ